MRRLLSAMFILVLFASAAMAADVSVYINIPMATYRHGEAFSADVIVVNHGTETVRIRQDLWVQVHGIRYYMPMWGTMPDFWEYNLPGKGSYVESIEFVVPRLGNQDGNLWGLIGCELTADGEPVTVEPNWFDLAM